MKTTARVLKLNDDVEEEVLLRIGSAEVTCFAAYCPFKLEEGASYEVEVNAQVLDEYRVSAAQEAAVPSIRQVGRGFAHVITGRLRGNRIEAGGVEFEDEELLGDFGHLDGKMVEWTVDRIDVEFLGDGPPARPGQ